MSKPDPFDTKFGGYGSVEREEWIKLPPPMKRKNFPKKVITFLPDRSKSALDFMPAINPEGTKSDPEINNNLRNFLIWLLIILIAAWLWNRR